MLYTEFLPVTPDIYNLDAVVKLPGGILLGEGGMGKSTFLKQLKELIQDNCKVLLLDLKNYTEDQQSLKDEVKKHCENAISTGFTDKLHIIFDGLDEAHSLAGTIGLLIRNTIPDAAKIWIASRDIPELQAIRETKPFLTQSYNLAPLSASDVRSIADVDGVDGNAFFEAASMHGLLPICAKPMGCKVAVKAYKRTQFQSTTPRKLWIDGIQGLCEETDNAKAEQQTCPQQEIVDCASWIALCLNLSGKNSIWKGKQNDCPEGHLCLDDLQSNSFRLDLLKKTIRCGVFRPLGNSSVNFTYEIYQDVLAAQGFEKFIPPKNWDALLFNADRKAVFPQRQGVAAWLASGDKDFCLKLYDVHPELLLLHDEAVNFIGPRNLCERLLCDAYRITYTWRHNGNIGRNLHRLKCDETATTIKSCLKNKQLDAAIIDLAIHIATACEFDELAEICAERALDAALPYQERINAARAVMQLKNDAAKEKLKALLKTAPQDDPEDTLRGVALMSCWPALLSVHELTPQLKEPQKKNFIGSWDMFLRVILPNSLCKENANLADTESLLNWAIKQLAATTKEPVLRETAQRIFTACWRIEGNTAITQLLADGYFESNAVCNDPFEFDNKYFSNNAFTAEDFQNNSARRLEVFDVILSSQDFDPYALGLYPFTNHRLCTEQDIELLIDKILASPTGVLADKYLACIKHFLFDIDVNAFSAKMETLYKVRPDVAKEFHQLIRTNKERKEKFALEDDKRQEQTQNEQQQHYDSIKNDLATPNISPDIFPKIVAKMAGGNSVYNALDIRSQPGFKILTGYDQKLFANLAERYLTEINLPPAEESEENYKRFFTEAVALITLRELDPQAYHALPITVWERCGVGLLKIAVYGTEEFIDQLLDAFAERCPENATKTLLSLISQRFGSSTGSILMKWGKRLTREQADAVLRLAKEYLAGEKLYELLQAIATTPQLVVASEYLDSVFQAGWKVPAEAEFHQLRKLAFILNPAKYVDEMLTAFSEDIAWGRECLEAMFTHNSSEFIKALLTCTPGQLAKFYIWMRVQYPPEIQVPSDNALSAWRGGSIQEAKNTITDELKQGREGSSAACNEILAHFPDNAWLTALAHEAYIAEQANYISNLPIPDIKTLAEAKDKFLLASITDLMAIVLEFLGDYQIYLTGDRPAIDDLWNIVTSRKNKQELIRPCTEEDLSDHLARYLKLRFPPGIVVNREVQVRRKGYPNGAPGSRTDLWVQATSKTGNIITLCIEVKCNWNQSADTAIQNQLIAKYMTGGTATGGILLLGWFACAGWDTADNRLKNSTSTWQNSDAAKTDLENQAKQVRHAGSFVNSFVLDCSLK